MQARQEQGDKQQGDKGDKGGKGQGSREEELVRWLETNRTGGVLHTMHSSKLSEISNVQAKLLELSNAQPISCICSRSSVHASLQAAEPAGLVPCCAGCLQAYKHLYCAAFPGLAGMIARNDQVVHEAIRQHCMSQNPPVRNSTKEKFFSLLMYTFTTALPASTVVVVRVRGGIMVGARSAGIVHEACCIKQV